MKLLFVADPVEKLNVAGDSSLALLRSALKRGHEVHWAVGEDVEFVGDSVAVWAQRVLECAEDAPPRLEGRKFHPITAMKAVFIRKDPPFDAGYVKLCWLLALAEKKVWMLNPPSVLLRYHEKLVPLEARAQGFLEKDDVIPTHIGDVTRAQELMARLQVAKVVTKPFLGFGGGNIELHEAAEFQALKAGNTKDFLAQPFREEVLKFGDRRVFFLEGELLAHFVRRPKAGGFIANLAQGGTAVSEPLTTREKEVIERLGRFLKSAGILLAGADLMGPLVSEVNITSPTGLRSLHQLDGKDYSDTILEYAEKATGV